MARRRSEHLLSISSGMVVEPDVVDAALDSHRPSLSGSAAELVALAVRHPRVLARIELRLAARLALIALGRRPMTADPGDRRFEDEAWQRQPVFRRALQGYLAWADALTDLVAHLPVDDVTRRRLSFVVRHMVAASAPSNLFLTHPGFYEQLMATRGRSLVAGLRQLVFDLRHHRGLPRQVDASAFRIGHDLAATPGAVIYRDARFELIQYAPQTETVDALPLLCVPPQINKYYVMDLAPERSVVEAAVAAGQTVFMMSWRNPTAAQRDWGLSTYVQAVDDAIDIVADIADGAGVKLVGACAGGLTAAVALARRNIEGRGAAVACLSLWVTLLAGAPEDAETAAPEGRAIRQALASSSRRGVLDGADMARAFAWLRPEDLIWRFVTHNYVLGKTPPASDILYWNSDTTRLPARLHADLLSIYTADTLCQAGGVVIDATPIDLKRIEQDVFIMAGGRDHIAPWRACHRAAALLGGEVRFVRVDAGHVQSVVCPSATGIGHASGVCGPDESADDWLAQARPEPGSWWPEWLDWCRARGGADTPAPRHYGNRRHEPIDAAPGRYVRQR